jgi:hypothetical protein
MSLQNRVTPFGDIIATEARGTMMGNRGGKFHHDDQTLGRRRWASHHWICCELHYKDMHHDPMGKGYTSLFFLDEVTALAAGHRPCFFCRRADAKRFFALTEPKLSVDEADRIAHRQRIPERESAIVGRLPDGTMISRDDGIAWAISGSELLRWSPSGYTEAVPRVSAMTAMLLTPPLYVGILARGYEPRWHESALQWRGGAA